MDMHYCPICHDDTVSVDLDFDVLGDCFECPRCGASLCVEHDYSGPDYDVSFWLQHEPRAEDSHGTA